MIIPAFCGWDYYPKTGEFSGILPPEARDSMRLLSDKSIKSRGGYLSLTIDLPKRPRSTGKHSQNSRVFGHCADIAKQLSAGDVTYSTEKIYAAMKLMAMKAGEWPSAKDEEGQAIVNPITKELEPMSQADATMEEDYRLDKYITWWADTNNLWLTEYVNKIPKRVYYGEREQP
jgi:hypothetical protein